MRAIAEAETANYGFTEMLDQFAALGGSADATAAVGGYRVLQPSRKRGTDRTLAALARARLRLTGFLSVILAGGLGLAVLAGPSSCACAITMAAPTQSNPAPHRPAISRLSYMQTPSSLAASRLAARFAGEIPHASPVALQGPRATGGVSPISTSALSARVGSAEQSGDLAPKSIGRLPTKIEKLADVAPPTIRVAAAALIDSETMDTLPAVVVDTPEIPKAIAAEDESRHVTKTRSRIASRPKSRPVGILGYKAPTGSPKGHQPPRWARQMFDNPWQSRAFSYQ